MSFYTKTYGVGVAAIKLQKMTGTRSHPFPTEEEGGLCTILAE